MRSLLPIVALLCLFTSAGAQSQLFNDFQGIKSKGDIPDEFISSWNNRAQERFHADENTQWGKEDEELLEKFWVQSHYGLNSLLRRGLVSFGDPVTLYLNKIKDNILKEDEELRSQIRIYLFKSPIVNASCFSDGTIFVNVGLVARAKSEAELAFVISHEISHYTERHILKSFYESDAIRNEKRKKYKDLSYIQVFNIINQRSQEHEFDADEKGMELFLKSGYHFSGIDGTMDILHQSYLPFEEKSVSTSFLNVGALNLPLVYFKDELDPISGEEDYFDETHSHPNIHRRRSTLNELLKFKNPTQQGETFFESKEEFEAITNLARFESVKQEVNNGRYGDALYHVLVLQEEYPNNKFLNIAFGKALYGLACYKAINRYKQVAESYTRVEGQSQQVHFVLRQFNRKQLTSISLYHILKLIEKYPNDAFLHQYKDQLTKLMMTRCGLTASDFEVDGPLEAFTKPIGEFKNKRTYLRAKQRHFKGFYKHLFQKELNNGWLEMNLEKHRGTLDSLKMERKLTAKYKKSRAKSEERKLEKMGSGLKINELIVLDPFYKKTSLENVKDYQEALELEQGLKRDVLNISQANGVASLPFFMEEMKKGDVEKFNEFSEMKQWIDEASRFYAYNLKPTGIDALALNRINIDQQYVCLTSGVVYSQIKESWYYFTIFDLKKGEVVYRRSEDLNRKISIKEFQEEFLTDIERIKR